MSMRERHGLSYASITLAALWSFPAVAELPTHPAVAHLGPTATESQLSDDPESPFPLNDPGFGSAVAIRNGIALVGIPAAFPTGHVAVYAQTATGWARTATLSVSDPVPAGSGSNGFGRALVFRDGLAVIASSSFVHVFKRASGVWTHVQKLDLNLDLRAISAMHFENGILAIGLNPSTGSGLVQVFELAATGKFVKRATLRAPGGLPGFGAAVGLAGNTLVVGGADNAVYVFRRRSDGAWVRTQKLIGADSSPVDSFGAAVAIDRGLIIVGAPDHDCVDGVGLRLCARQSGDTGAGGAAYGFVPFNGQYVQVFKLRPNAQEHQFYWKFGRRIAMMGQYVVIDAAEQGFARDPDISPGDILGLSFTYSRDGSTLTARGIARGFIESDSIGLANNWLLVGSTHDGGIGCIAFGSCAGEARVFDLNRFAK
jgi:hypothetical protein